MTVRGKSGAGRPAASSHEALEEAACELALELGWDSVSADDIARRAGVSRSSFFNYFASKSDVLWSNVDVALESATTLHEFVDRLEELGPPTALTYVETMGAASAAEESAVTRSNRLAKLLGQGRAADDVVDATIDALADAGLADAWSVDVADAGPVDARSVDARFVAAEANTRVIGEKPVPAASIRRIQAAALASGTLAAILEWAAAGIGRAPLSVYLDVAFGSAW
ncbi:MAG: TetR/AcrR family transcriptional regulator [Gulosibacter sp.]|uniref:TetR/AcrR family transcriptional regulator n=1 Tax=Gulosibacter sp. TaxID=2817531 RepID=UPI003F8E2B0F